MMPINLPLMENNITGEDLKKLMTFLKTKPRLTNGENVLAFERQWSKWVGVKHSVYVNSGSSANILTLAALKFLHGTGEVIVPSLTWVSDIAAVLHSGFTPVFVDINPRNLCMDTDQVIKKLSKKTKAVFITYVQGFNGLDQKLLTALKKNRISLIEDVCEAHGATFKSKKLGSFGLASNFSFYFAHHMSTVEGGMVCTNDRKIYEIIRMLRSHGMVRESQDPKLKSQYARKYPDLSPDFIFAFPGYNMRGTEIGAVLGLNQLKRLNQNNAKRKENFKFFLENLDPAKFQTDFDLQGSCNYALNLILRNPNPTFCKKLESALKAAKVEYRRGSSGGGNQLRQPYLKTLLPKGEYKKYPHVEHVHFYGYYIGNYSCLKKDKILSLCRLVNSIS